MKATFFWFRTPTWTAHPLDLNVFCFIQRLHFSSLPICLFIRHPSSLQFSSSHRRNMKMTALFTWPLLSCCLLLLLMPTHNRANQITYLDGLVKSLKSSKVPRVDAWQALDEKQAFSPVYVGSQVGMMEADKIDKLPGQPEGVNFSQYGGYVTVDPQAGRALFYYFVESSQDPSTKPLVLWLNGGPGCSSLGFGAMEELGPFRVMSDRKTLFKNDYAWNNEANVLFLESPAGVGFSYSNTSSDYNSTGDKRTAEDAYTFLINWLERFPQYKTRDFYITGESYAGHYVPQLAYTILSYNTTTNHTLINLKGMAVGNPWIDYETNMIGQYDYFWTHALNSDQTNAAIHANCNFSREDDKCFDAEDDSSYEIGGIDIYDIYAPLCHDTNLATTPSGSIFNFDPCSDFYIDSYLNLAEVQKALHANVTGLNYEWSSCSPFIGFSTWKDSPDSLLPIIEELISSGISIWIYSGDTDGRCPVTSSRYFVNKLGLPIQTSWRPWYSNSEVGGYVVGYKGVTLVTVRGAGHLVPSYQPQRALTMISSFLKGILPPSS